MAPFCMTCQTPIRVSTTNKPRRFACPKHNPFNAWNSRKRIRSGLSKHPEDIFNNMDEMCIDSQQAEASHVPNRPVVKLCSPYPRCFLPAFTTRVDQTNGSTLVKLILFEKSRVELEFVFSIFTTKSPETLWELSRLWPLPVSTLPTIAVLCVCKKPQIFTPPL